MKYMYMFVLLFSVSIHTVAAPEKAVDEQFSNLYNWRVLKFDKINTLSSYRAVKEGDTTILQTKSSAGASGLVYKKTFDIYEFPRIEWKWRVDGVIASGDATKKDGDDFPLRIYILFKYDPAIATAWEKVRFEAIKLIYGEYPPHSSINYIWANRKHSTQILPNPFTDRVQMIIKQSGDSQAGVWKIETADMLADYKRAFGKEPPATASLAIMTDTDNTGGSASAAVEYIKVYR